MDDWIKILISTFVGFFGGVVAEPVKLILGKQLHQRTFRKAVYAELLAITGRMAALLQFAQTQSSDEALLWGLHTFDLCPISLDVFEHYYQSERPLIYSIPEAPWLIHIHRMINHINQLPKEDASRKACEIRKTLEHIYSLVERGSLQSKALAEEARLWRATDHNIKFTPSLQPEE
jgi:hypothetical protein